MNRYDYYTRCCNVDEQEWLTEELYYPEDDGCSAYSEGAYDETYGNNTA